MKILQDYIVPVVAVESLEVGYSIRRTFGTAFFVNGEGIFITARHVVENAQAYVENNGGAWGLSMRAEPAAPFRVHGSAIEISFADAPYDVAVGRTDQPARSYFQLDPDVKAWIWFEVYAAGYPETATKELEGGVLISPRGFAGTVLRTLAPGNSLSVHNPHPDVIEVSFPIPVGISGGPLMLMNATDPAGKPIPYFLLLGVCVGSESAEFTDHYITEVTDGGEKFSERTVRVEQYGLVHDLRPLAEWRPDVLGGDLTLRELIRPSD